MEGRVLVRRRITEYAAVTHRTEHHRLRLKPASVAQDESYTPLEVQGYTNAHRLYPHVLHEAGFRCVIGDADDPGHATYPSWYPLGALDKVFVRGAVRTARAHPSRLALARVASDHLPLVAEIEVDPK